LNVLLFPFQEGFVFALVLVRLQVAGWQQSLLWFQWPR
jgi:hypothetical protein